MRLLVILLLVLVTPVHAAQVVDSIEFLCVVENDVASCSIEPLYKEVKEVKPPVNTYMIPKASVAIVKPLAKLIVVELAKSATIEMIKEAIIKAYKAKYGETKIGTVAIITKTGP